MLAQDLTGRILALCLFRTEPCCAWSVLSRPRADILPVRPSCLVDMIIIYLKLKLFFWPVKISVFSNSPQLAGLRAVV